MIIAIGNDGQFRAFCQEMGVAEWAEDDRFRTSRQRLIHRDTIEYMVQELVRGHQSGDLIERLSAAGVPCGPVNTIPEIFADPFIAARGTVHHYRRDDGVEIPTVAFPGKLSATPADYRYQPPKVGEHTQDLLREWLSLSEDDLAGLEAAGTIVQRKEG
jgi:crotonobetainyl-CoA:carnitine CoA-transferase CaiB-like acyl-CoA transferase